MEISINDLKKMPVWVNWKLEERDGKKTKVPYNPHTSGKAMSNNRDTWTTFDYAQSKSADYSGVGFMFADGICGIDIDNKTGNPEFDRQAETIIKLMDTYTERSPSGTGCHIIFKCDMSKIPVVNGKLNDKYYYKNPHNDLECYFAGLTNRYFTYTGEVINNKNIGDRTEQVLIFIENYMLRNNFKERKERKESFNNSLKNELSELSELSGLNGLTELTDKIRKSRHGCKFSALYDRGDISAYNNDDSAADLALCNILAFWLQGDFNQIDNYFSQSALNREKWERADYKRATINKAVESCNGKFYTPPGRLNKSSKKTKSEQRGYSINKKSPKVQKSQKSQKLLDKLTELQPHENYYWNDLGSSRLFADIFRDYYRYNYTAKEWYIFDGRKWIEDTGGSKTLRQFERLYDNLLNYATTLEDMTKKSNYFDYIIKLGKASERKRILEDTENICAVFRDDFDKNDDLFNCQNGTLNLRTLEFKPHSSADLLTKISRVHYNPAAKSPLFEKFIDEVMQGSPEKKEYLQKALGYALTAGTHYETCFILYGATTRNGKSTLMSTVMYALGEHNGYALDMKPETLALKKNTDSRQASGDLARLDGCRFLNASEPPKRMIFDVALLKNMLGRDPITARNLYEKEFTFRPKFKLFINTNFLPLVTDDTLFKSGRINVITFDRHFSAEEQDKTLKDRLITQESISGIFNWLISGLQKFRTDGLEPPEAINNATAEYQRESDKIGKFISECLEKSQGDNCKAGDVYFIYEKWCDANGYRCENKGNFFAELKNKNIFAASGRVNGNTYKNIVKGYIIMDNQNSEPPLANDKDVPVEIIKTDMPYPHF